MEATPGERGQQAPKPFDGTRADFELAYFSDDARSAAVLEDPGVRALVAALTGNSSYLARLLKVHPEWIAALFCEPPSQVLDRLIEEMTDAINAPDQANLMKLLRLAKAKHAVLVASADITGIWTLEQVTDALTRLADVCVRVTLDWLMKEAARKGQLLVPPETACCEGSGIVILGMGKYGAGELNYSSDIDLVIFYEPDTLPLKEGIYDGEFCVKLGQGLVRIMQERTGDGYVFRTDLRLRPDPGATPIAVSLPAAEVYYESRGQNWERAAFIKARPVAGDLEAGARFLKGLEPYVWRRNLDFAAIADIHSMKRQIHAVQGHGHIAVAGHNIKLGRGGIREIEFFVQTQQLIAGGRDRDLRGRATVPMLHMLAQKKWISDRTAGEMEAAYRFLRTLEHRLQMINDEQTQMLPSSERGLDHVACFMGFGTRDAFAAVLTQHLENVQSHYAQLFEMAPSLAEEGGSLVFTGTEDDPETLETLRRLGFHQVSEISQTVRGWHSGRFAATRSPRSRELLTALMPELLKALGRTSDPDRAFTHFDRFLTGLPAGVQLFSMFYSNPSLLTLLAGICGTAPRLAHYLSQNPAVLDAVLAPDFFTVLPDREVLRESLAQALAPARDYQDVLDFARVWARDHRFRLGVRVLTGSADAEEAGPAYAALAGELVTAMVPVAETQMAGRHGVMPGGECVVVAMGKLGSEEMSAGSDLDLIMIYDVENEETQSQGPRPLFASQYYARLCQQLVSSLTAPTAEGKLYEVDLRLRPSGNAGPVATRLASFIAYQASEAWTWEHMALTRARALSGPGRLKSKVSQAIHATLTARRDPEKTAADVADMRRRIAGEFPGASPWDLKYVPGGLIDLEFICQHLQLVHGHAHEQVLATHTRLSFQRLHEAGVLTASAADTLIAGLDLHQNLTQILRICVTGPFQPAEVGEGLRALLARAGNAPDFSALEAQLRETQGDIRDLFETLVAPLQTSI
ncbi:MAG: bifunctional [glutamine synthetase] adenylyltransferase/[glutamine synthetase]-adenylyl-L-tyrosine phosphorylase [Parvibaculaceae bacterium]|nr:bifunctional [glutamine synthetase] adenylyltransferase/[glutamine synthetase]-adenylyl-L-tyrosine phosphorylase [Parvibaculaceae bacterium]